jgi:glycosyltransferase involved in cell wall biosynthesis
MNKIQPYFSVIICCFNSEKFIKETIDSVINQSFKDWEIVLVDDGSTDSTARIVEDYMSQGININYFFQENRGFACARNKCLELAKGKWIVIIDHDDICLPERLNIHNNQILNNPNCGFFFGNTIHFSSESPEIKRHFDSFNIESIKLGQEDVSRSLIESGCFVDSESVMFNKEIALEYAKFNESFRYIADYDFFIKMGFHTNFSYTKEVLSKWRIHKSQATENMKLIYKVENIKLLTGLFWIKSFSFTDKLHIALKLLKSFLRLVLRPKS